MIKKTKLVLIFRKYQKIIFFIILALILVRPLGVVINHSEDLFSSGFNSKYEEYKDFYYSSQYVQKKNPRIMTDEGFLAFAGGAMIKGMDPILIIHDHPPLGKYIVALSIILFDNPRTVIVFSLFFVGLGILMLGRLTIGSWFFALIPLGIFINEPLFLNKLIYAPLVEPIQLPFILFSFYFFVKALTDKKYLRWFIITSILIGFVISIRFFITGAIIAFCMTLYLFYEERKINKKFLSFLFTLPLALIVLLLSYTRTMMNGYSVIQIFGIQKYILKYHASKFILPFSFWDLLLFNRWHTWWGDWSIQHDPQWIFLWPLSAILSFLNLALGLLKKINLNSAEKFLSFWLIIYLISLSTGYSSTNYFLVIVPIFYILSTSLFSKLLYRYKLI